MDKKIIYTGTDIFEKLIENNGYYVDKTKIIEELFEKRSDVTLFPRPRRFGKTLTMSMLASFFDIEKDSKNLFKGLYIESSHYSEHMNKYPVIFLTFKGIGMNSFEETKKEFIDVIVELYNKKDYVRKVLKPSELEYFNAIVHRTADISYYQNAIKHLMEFMSRYHDNKKVIVLIDEYDSPINKGYIKEYYDEIVDLIRKVFDGIFKTNDNLFFAVLTGVLRVSKESLLSDPNNIKVRGIIDSDFGEYFGFTEDDTKEVLEYYGRELTSEVKDMYDGYNFNGVGVYNPWSIMNYVEEGRLNNYWINTSGNELIRIMLNDTSDENKAKIEKLIQGESIAFTYDDKLTYKDFDDHSDINILLNLFFASGYLTLDRIEKTGFGDEVCIKIPNKEVNEFLVKIMMENVYGSVSNSGIRELTNAVENYDLVTIEKVINNVLSSASYVDLVNENGYHAFMIGFFGLYLNNDNYIFKSNREGGSGRYDVMIERANREYGYIFEFKIAKSDEDMESIAKDALDQIETKEYYKELVLDKVKTIRKVSIVFSNKTCIVR